VWASRLQATPLPERVAGSTMIWALTEAAARAGTPIFLLGGSPGVAERTRQIFRERYPGVRIAGTHCPPLGFERDPEAMREVIDALRDGSPSMIYLALGHPKQEQLARRLRPLFPNAWFIGLGFSFGFVAGEARRAPAWMQRLGLEWMHRLAQEPRRLFTRYVVHGLPFALRLLAHAYRTRRRLRAAG
jgi:N-acetylglucosaminyldiphosphoundecaprenol N-acetyl-beta-D-mannosaminyltransferase